MICTSSIGTFFVACQLAIVFGVSIWPQPNSLTYGGTDTYQIDASSFQFALNSGFSPFLQKAFSRYESLAFYGSLSSIRKNRRMNTKNNKLQNTLPLKSLIFEVASLDETLQFQVDESYTLNISSPVAYVYANTVFGALHGLESFSQLIEYNGAAYIVDHGPIKVSDSPRFAHRGLLIDSARHFLPVSTIKNAIDALSYSKMNVLHWHAVDAQSFPVESTSFPDLTNGAWTVDEVYSASDISDVVQYAHERGVRVMPEFDVPGHSYSWGIGYPSLTVSCPAYEANVNNIPLDPTNDFTYTVLQAFLTEMSTLFTENFLHMGGDEVVTGCYEDNQNITNWMNQHGISNVDQLISIFETKLRTIVSQNGKTFVGWQELFDSYGLSLPSSTIIEVWKDEPTLLSIAKAKLRGILAYGWYLNHLQEDWTAFYQNEPFVSSEWTPALKSFIIGGEVCAWGEQLDFANFDSRVWPRTAAAAERLWSPSTITNLNTATPRLNDYVCVLNRRGINSAPIQPGPSCFPSSK